MITIISFDVEVDGRIPGRNSIRQLGSRCVQHGWKRIEPLLYESGTASQGDDWKEYDGLVGYPAEGTLGPGSEESEAAQGR